MAQYFVGITLPASIDADVEIWRRRFRAPKTPAHLTLIPPFTWDGDGEALVADLEKQTNVDPPVLITAQGLGSFGQAVIYIAIDGSDHLMEVQKKLAEGLSQKGIPRDKRAYHPHITLATRLDLDEFRAYQQELEDYHPTFSFWCSKAVVFRLNQKGKYNRWEKM